MTPRPIRLLHVEDDETQQLIVRHHLEKAAEFQFVTTCVTSEDEAVDACRRGGVELVILDYHLTQGNGLSCLKRLRQLDPILPIVAISGIAGPTTAAELLHAGADDYIAKQDLRSDVLARSVRVALTRADAWRRRAPARKSDPGSRVKPLLQQMGSWLATTVGQQMLERLDEIEKVARIDGLTPTQVEQAFEIACAVLETGDPTKCLSVRRVLRPMLLELLLRLSGEPTSRPEAGAAEAP